MPSGRGRGGLQAAPAGRWFARRIDMPPAANHGPSIIDFPPFRLDLRAGQLRHDAKPVSLRPKTFAVLQHLAQRPGELVSKQALLDAVWSDVAVSEDVVRLSVGELRAALGDLRVAPRFIETVPRRGYRFIAKLGTRGSSPFPGATQAGIDAAAAVDGAVVGRARERSEIAAWFQTALTGRRRMGFVTGEAGIGKTTLVDAVLRDLQLGSGLPLRVARGQCVEQYGAGEPYMPVLEALSLLCRGADAEAVALSLREHAPGWLVRAMELYTSREVEGTLPASSTEEHTLHRLGGCLAALAAETPLVVVLEDVQWSDYSTLDLLSVIAHGREPARLLVICTLRPADAIVRGHPVTRVKRELVRKGLCREVLLGGLPGAEVASYLAVRFDGADLPEDLLPLLVDCSEGNPFFMVTLLDHLLGERLLVHGGNGWELRGGFETLRTTIPDGLRAIIEPRLEQLAPDELRVLEAGSVAGLEFPAHAVAHVGGDANDLGDIARVEQLCDALVRRQEILRAMGESAWPDGTASARYGFRHALYRQVIYQGLSSSSRRRLHQRIGEGLEAAHGGRTAEVASELAAHFECSRDVDRAVRYHGEAAAVARLRSAYQEARFHLEAALSLLQAQAQTAERLERQISLLHDLGSTLFSLKGYGDEGAVRAFTQMREIAERLDAAPIRLRAMDGLLLAHTMRAELVTARDLAEKMIVSAEQLGNPVAAVNARVTLGAALFNLGEVEAGRQYAERIRAPLDTESPPLPAVLGISSCCLLALAYAHLGRIGQARAMVRESLARAAQYGVPYFRAHATNFAAQVCVLLRDVTSARSLAEETIHLATAYRFSVLRIAATMVRGWCDVEDGHVVDGLAALRGAFEEYATTGQRISTTAFSLLLAGAHLALGDGASADAVVDAALAFAAETGERVYEHELYRLKGECRLASASTRRAKSDATEYFDRALAIAARRKALLFELRSATSLCRVEPSAHERLVGVVGRFSVEDDCADLRAARALLGTG
jgi:DNA-binding winged helix-turn-helix (wHTH) protein/tetratricopeptide (TPR) repeat protein